MMFGECHAHIFMNGYNYKKAVETHCDSPDEQDIRRHMKAYKNAGVTFVRDGGDRFGASLLAKKLSPEYGITYLTPGYAIYKKNHYGSVVGEAFTTMKEYEALVVRIQKTGGDFVKIMTTGIMDFDTDGHITGQALPKKEVSEMVEIAHNFGFKVMSHTNSAQAVIDAVESGVDSIEHGNFQNEESIACMAEHTAVWVPTLVTVRNLIGCGRFSDEVLKKIAHTQRDTLQLAYHKGVSLALGSDAGASMVPHAIGIMDEYQAFCTCLGESEKLEQVLHEGEDKIRLFQKN